MSIFDRIPKDDVEIVAHDGTIRHQVKANVQPMQIIIADPLITVLVGDEIRRKLPNGTEEAFEVLDPSYFSAFHSMPAHFQIKVRRKGTFPAGQGGNYAISVSGPNARVNIHSQDNSQNTANDAELFTRLADAIETQIIDADQKHVLQSLNNEMRTSVHDHNGFLQAYQRFISAAGQHMAIIAPFLPALGQLMGSK